MTTPIEELIEKEKARRDSNPFKPGTQCHRLLEFLRAGPRTNAEIVEGLRILKYTGRISELREKNFDVRAERLGEGLWRYSLG